MIGWFGSIVRRKQIRADRKSLKKRVRRFLECYLAADPEKQIEFYEAIAGAVSGCRPSITDPSIQNIELAQTTSERALKVVQARLRKGADVDHVQTMFTDAYATVAIAIVVPLRRIRQIRKCSDLGRLPSTSSQWPHLLWP